MNLQETHTHALALRPPLSLKSALASLDDAELARLSEAVDAEARQRRQPRWTPATVFKEVSMIRRISLVLVLLCLTACVSGTITGPNNLHQPPQHGWTKDQVRAHWGSPYSTSYYGNADTWLYRRSYFVTTGHGNYMEAEYASVSFYDGKVVGVSY